MQACAEYQTDVKKEERNGEKSDRYLILPKHWPNVDKMPVEKIILLRFAFVSVWENLAGLKLFPFLSREPDSPPGNSLSSSNFNTVYNRFSSSSC